MSRRLRSAIALTVVAACGQPSPGSEWCRVAWLLLGRKVGAGVGPPGSFGGGQRAAGLVWLLGQQPAGLGGGEQAGFHVGVVEDAAGGQAVKADPGLIESVVAAALGGVGDLGKFLGGGGLDVGMADGSQLNPGRRGRSWL